MKRTLTCLSTLCLSIIVLAGCASPPAPASHYPEINVLVTEDQKFVVNGEKVNTAEFFDKSVFNRSIKTVIFNVTQQSKAQRSSMLALANTFIARGYTVKMAPDSKFADLLSPAEKL